MRDVEARRPCARARRTAAASRAPSKQSRSSRSQSSSSCKAVALAPRRRDRRSSGRTRRARRSAGAAARGSNHETTVKFSSWARAYVAAPRVSIGDCGGTRSRSGGDRGHDSGSVPGRWTAAPPIKRPVAAERPQRQVVAVQVVAEHEVAREAGAGELRLVPGAVRRAALRSGTRRRRAPPSPCTSSARAARAAPRRSATPCSGRGRASASSSYEAQVSPQPPSAF